MSRKKGEPQEAQKRRSGDVVTFSGPLRPVDAKHSQAVPRFARSIVEDEIRRSRYAEFRQLIEKARDSMDL